MEKRKPKKLKHTSSGQVRDIIIGPRAVLEAIKAEKSIDKILINRELVNEQTRAVLDEAKKYNIPVSKVPDEKLNRISRKNHQGIIALAAPITFSQLDYEIETALEHGIFPLVIILDGVTDVRNFGAIARSAEAMGAGVMVIPMQHAARVGDDAMKTSAGALSHIKVVKTHRLKEALLYLQSYGYQVVACTEKGDIPIYSIDFTRPTAIIMGAEDSGINNELLKVSDLRAFIPMVGKIASLNVSAAATAILYEVLRQRVVK